MARQPQRGISAARRTGSMYVSPEAAEIIQMVEAETGDAQLAQSLQFSPTALTHVKRMIAAGGSIVVDTSLIESDVDASLLEGTDAEIKCFIDAPEVIQLAQIRRTTRAEIAADIGLSLPGPKLMVVGSAPAALNRIIARRKQEPLSDVCVLAAPSGYASVVQLKEKLRECDMAYIVVRGKKGGTAQTVVILNSILKVIQKNANAAVGK